MTDFLFYSIICISAIGAGFINAIAGGGTLITYPVLVALGIPPVFANVTNTIALCPGYIGGTIAQRNDLKGQKKRMVQMIPFAVAGGITGGLLLLFSDEKIFTQLVPYLIFLASFLLMFQDRLKNALKKRDSEEKISSEKFVLKAILIFFATVYGGYFGAGLGVILLAVLALIIEDKLIRLNALKQTLSLSANVAAALFFLFSDKVIWPVVLVMALAAYLGGYMGSKLAGHVNPAIFKWSVVSIGFVIGFIFLLKQYS